MCSNSYPVRSLSFYGVKSVTVPCGKCAECRKAYRNQWVRRLQSEIEHYHVRKGYNVGFVTLTYRPAFLPTIPKKFFKAGDYESIACFNYLDIKHFADTIRNWFFRETGIRNAFRFFLSCEYGEERHRPHYHGILLFHPSVSHEKMFHIVSDAWNGTNIVIPQPRKKSLRRKPLGNIGEFADFVPRDPQACGRYCAKYACKDIAFLERVGDRFSHLSGFLRNEFRHYTPFHKQSMSFGYNLIVDKDDEELFDLLETGFQLTGTPYFSPLPHYLRDKILFNTRKYYDINSHSWRTRKLYSKFFMDNRDKIASLVFQRNYYRFQQLCTKEYWEVYPAKMCWETPAEVACSVTSLVNDFGGIDEIVSFYTFFYGIPSSRCAWLPSAGDQLIMRYDPIADCTDFPAVDPDWHYCMSIAVRSILAYGSYQSLEERKKSDELIDRIRAFFNNMR